MKKVNAMTLHEFHERQQILLDIFTAYYGGILIGNPEEDPSSEKEWMNEYKKWLDRIIH